MTDPQDEQIESESDLEDGEPCHLSNLDPSTQEMFRDGVWHAPRGRLTRIAAIAILMLILGSICGLVYVLIYSASQTPATNGQPVPATPTAIPTDANVQAGSAADRKISDKQAGVALEAEDLAGYWIFDDSQIEALVGAQKDEEAARQMLTQMSKAAPMMEMTGESMTMFSRSGSRTQPVQYVIKKREGNKFEFMIGKDAGASSSSPSGTIEVVEAGLRLINPGQTVPIPMRRMTTNEEKQYTQ